MGLEPTILSVLDVVLQLANVYLTLLQLRRRQSHEALPQIQEHRFTASSGTNTPMGPGNAPHPESSTHIN
jgi:hypothetical protein